ENAQHRPRRRHAAVTARHGARRGRGAPHPVLHRLRRCLLGRTVLRGWAEHAAGTAFLVAEHVVWRIARRAHALDRRGTGARLAGGRWNRPGTPVIYAGCTIAITALERFVHLAGVVPPDLVLVRIQLPARFSSERPKLSELPE